MHFLHRAHASVQAGLFPDPFAVTTCRYSVAELEPWEAHCPGHLRCLTAKPFNREQCLVQSLRQQRAGNTRPMMPSVQL